MRRRRAVWPARLVLAVGLISGFSAGTHAAEPVETALTVSPEAPGRLVLPYWPPAGWLVRQSGRLVEVAMPGAELVIATEAIALPAANGGLDTLGSELTEEGSVLHIGLGCDCTLAVHGDGQRLLIDIVGAGRLAGPLYRDAGPAPRLARVPPARPRPAAGLAGVAGPDVEETRSRILEQLQRAANAGLVTLRTDGGGLLADPVAEPRTGAASGQATPFQSAPDETASGGPASGEADLAQPASGEPRAGEAAVAVTTRQDSAEAESGASVARAALPVRPVQVDHEGPRGLTAPSEIPPMPAMAAALAPLSSPEEVREALIGHRPAPDCVASENFMLPDPMPPQAFLEEVSRLRRALVGEFDRSDPSTAVALARLYLGHGLGAEALRILSEFAPSEPETPLLAAISHLAEERPLPSRNLLAVSGCRDQHALWQAFDAALDRRPAEAMRLLDGAAGALEQVTHGLRGRLAVHLGLAAAQHGDWIAAHRLETMANRSLAADDRAGHEMRTLLAALVLRERGDRAEAARLLAELGRARSSAGGEALLVLAEWAESGGVEEALQLDRIRLDLGGLVTVHRGSALGGRAFRAELRTTGRLLGRDAAFDLLDYGREAGLIGEADYEELMAETGAAPQALAGDTPLAILYETEPLRFSASKEDRDFRVALARSYLSLGTPALAERVLLPEDLADSALRRDLSAAYLDAGDPGASERLAGSARASLRGTLEAGRAVAGSVSGAPGQASAAPGMIARSGNVRKAGDVEKPAVAMNARASAAGPQAPARSRNAGAAEGEMQGNVSELAVRLALEASRAGLTAPPAEAVGLVASKPALEAGLRAIFASAPADPAEGPGEAISRLLDGVSAEARLYREVLQDG